MKNLLSSFVAIVLLQLFTNAQTNTVLAQSVQNNVLNNGNASAYNPNTRGPQIPVFNPKDDTKGSRYLFANFIKGIITNTGAGKIDNNYLFNYDKITQKFLLTQDEKNYFSVEDQNVKFFTLYNLGEEMVFVKVPAISNNFYVQQLGGKEGKYAFYKYTKTKLEKANYVSSGLIESGHNYDEFIDEYTYFIVFPDGATLKTVTFKRSAIKESLSGEEVKVGTYFNENKSLPVNESFVKGLIDFINQ
jgi:hypothetical protein